MRRYDLKNTNGEILWKKTGPEVDELFSLALIDQETTCRITGLKEWHDLNEYFPTLKYGYVPSVAPAKPTSGLNRPLGVDDHGERGKTSALKAGWICCGVGLAIAWIFPPAHFFYSVAVVLAIVAMCAHEVKRGLLLLFTCLASAALSALIFFGLALGTVAIATAPAIAKAEQDRRASQAKLDQNVQTMRTAASAPTTFAFPTSPSSSNTAARPLEQWTASQLLAEIARLEELHRASRKANRPVPKSIADQLVQAQAAYDAVSASSQ